MTQDEGKSPYKAFQPQDVEPKYARDRGFTVIDTTLDIKVDERAGTVEGKATLRVRPIVPVNTIELDAADMRINRVTVDKKPVRFEHDDDRLLVRTGRRLKEATEHDIVISYKATPRKGLYFVAPEGARKGLGWQVWSQGESEDNHHWFPGYDFPNNKATSDVRLTVRDPMRAISNGHLVATKKAGRGWTTYHWSQRVPQPNYLIAIVVGEFDEVSDEWDGIPLSYLVPKGKAAWAKETFKRTPEILAFFSRVTGYKYPYPKYTQAVIAEFMWGGMENTSLTTVNDRFLVLPEHRNDADPDGLVAHEAAHQWFGDLVTTKSWEHLWLNEAFATYFDALWHEDHYGADRLAYELMENAEAYFHEDSHEYRRALVTRGYRTNEDLFDRHTYQKGSFILHMLRQELGDDMWWRAIRHYVKANEWRNVETIDLKVAIEEATGRNVDAFFDQWVYRGGHPEFEASWSHDERHKQAKVTIKQTQKVVGETPRFRVKIKARVWIDDKKFKDETLEVSREEESFFLPSAKKPKAIELDPEGALLKKLKFERPVNEAVFVLSHAKSAIGRIEAAKALGKKPSDPESTQALAKAMSKDPFFGVRAACASALGEQGVEAARDALLAAKPDTDSRVRRHVADALGRFPKDEAAGKALQAMAAKDASEYVAGSALLALARSKQPKAFDVLSKALDRTSHNDVVAIQALNGLAMLRDAAAIAVASARTGPGNPLYVRVAAARCLANLWEFVERKPQEEIRDVLITMMRDSNRQVRRGVYAACAVIADGALASIVESTGGDEPVGLLAKLSRDTARKMREKAANQSKLADLRKRVEEMDEKNKKLEARLAQIEASLGAKAPSKRRRPSS